MFTIVTLVPFATGSVGVVNTYGSWLFVICVVAIEVFGVAIEVVGVTIEVAGVAIEVIEVIEVVGLAIEVVGVDALVVDERVVILKTPAVGVGDAGQTKS